MELEIELRGVLYRWDGRRWMNLNREIAPRRIAAELDALARAEIDGQDDEIRDPSRLTREAQQSARQGNFRRAVRLARRAYEIRPGEASAATLISILRRAHRPDQAAEVFEEFPDPRFGPLLTTGIALMMDLERWQEARALVGRAIALRTPLGGEFGLVIARLRKERPDLMPD